MVWLNGLFSRQNALNGISTLARTWFFGNTLLTYVRINTILISRSCTDSDMVFDPFIQIWIQIRERWFLIHVLIPTYGSIIWPIHSNSRKVKFKSEKDPNSNSRKRIITVHVFYGTEVGTVWIFPLEGTRTSQQHFTDDARRHRHRSSSIMTMSWAWDELLPPPTTPGNSTANT